MAAVGPLEHLVPQRVPEVWTGVRDLAPVLTANDCLSPTNTCTVSELLACLGIRHLLPPASGWGWQGSPLHVVAPAQRAPLEASHTASAHPEKQVLCWEPLYEPKDSPRKRSLFLESHPVHPCLAALPGPGPRAGSLDTGLGRWVTVLGCTVAVGPPSPL